MPELPATHLLPAGQKTLANMVQKGWIESSPGSMARYRITPDIAPFLRSAADAPGRSAVQNARLFAVLEMAADDAGTTELSATSTCLDASLFWGVTAGPTGGDWWCRKGKRRPEHGTRCF